MKLSTTPIDSTRIQEYAEKLRDGNFLETLALNVAMGIQAEITKKNEEVDDLAPQCVNVIEKVLKNQIVDNDFYLKIAKGILTRLATWIKEDRTEEELWYNAAFESSLSFLEPLDLSNRTMDELTAMLGLASQTVPATEPQLIYQYHNHSTTYISS